MSKKLVIIGAGGHGKVIADIAKLNNYDHIMFLDDNDSVVSCGGYDVVGKTASFMQHKDSDFVVAIGNATVRRNIQTILLENGVTIVTLIHPNAVVAEDVKIGLGSVVMAGAIINPGATIGDGCIINTASSVDHDCTISDYVHIAVGAHLSGTVDVGENTWVGTGAVISNNISVCADCIIGAGAVIIKDIEISGTYVGVPVRKIK